MGFNIAVNALTYTISGNSVSVPGFRATFNDASTGGGFDIASLDGRFQAFFYRPQLFVGPTDMPVFVGSVYMPSSGLFITDHTKFESGDVSNEDVHVLGSVQTPEPMAAALLGLGLAGIALRRRSVAPP